MKDFLETIVKSILGSDEYTIEEEDKKFEVKYTVTAKGNDLGKLIGRGGNTAKAIRTVVRALNESDKKIYIEFVEDK